MFSVGISSTRDKDSFSRKLSCWLMCHIFNTSDWIAAASCGLTYSKERPVSEPPFKRSLVASKCCDGFVAGFRLNHGIVLDGAHDIKPNSVAKTRKTILDLRISNSISLRPPHRTKIRRPGRGILVTVVQNGPGVNSVDKAMAAQSTGRYVPQFQIMNASELM